MMCPYFGFNQGAIRSLSSSSGLTIPVFFFPSEWRTSSATMMTKNCAAHYEPSQLGRQRDGAGPSVCPPSFSRSAQVVEASPPDSFLLPLFAPLAPSLPSICHDREPLTPPIDWPRRPVEASQRPTALPSALIRGCHNLPFSPAVDAAPTQKALDSPRRHGRAGVHLLQPLFSASTFEVRPWRSRCETMVRRIKNAGSARMYAQNENIHAMHTLLVYAPQPQEANHAVEHARRDSFSSSLSRLLLLPRVLRRGDTGRLVSPSAARRRPLSTGLRERAERAKEFPQ